MPDPRDDTATETMRAALGYAYDTGASEWRPGGVRYANREAAISAALVLAAPAPAPGDEGLRAIVREHIACCLEDPAGRDVDVETDDLMDALASPAPAATEVGEGER